MKYQLIIFDMDGTLVQSEHCASQALKNAIPLLADSVQELTVRYRGMRLANIFDDIERRFPGSIPDNCLDAYRVEEEHLAASMITPSVGADDMLCMLKHQKCIASNAPANKTRRSLEITSLSHHFSDNIYSAYDVEAWKPDPSLFLHAAASQGANPSHCLVVEDSEVGLQAARAAGMQSVFYSPNGETAPNNEINNINHLSQLIQLLA